MGLCESVIRSKIDMAEAFGNPGLTSSASKVILTHPYREEYLVRGIVTCHCLFQDVGNQKIGQTSNCFYRRLAPGMKQNVCFGLTLSFTCRAEKL